MSAGLMLHLMPQSNFSVLFFLLCFVPFKNRISFNCVHACLSGCGCVNVVQVPLEAGASGFSWSRTHKWLWAAPRGCWESNPCSPQEQYVLLTTEQSLQPLVNLTHKVMGLIVIAFFIDMSCTQVIISHRYLSPAGLPYSTPFSWWGLNESSCM